MKKIKSSEELINTFYNNLHQSINFNDKISLSVFDKWENIIKNKNLAINSKLIDIKNNTIIIQTNHSGWSQQILLNKKTIIKNINALYPELKIKDISIIIETDNLKPIIKNINSDKKIENNISFNDIQDEDLKNALKKLKKAIMQK